MKKAIRRLRLRKGDIVVVRDHNTAMRLMEMKGAVDFSVPIIVAPEGIHRISKAYLKRRLGVALPVHEDVHAVGENTLPSNQGDIPKVDVSHSNDVTPTID
jgi:hypothetical protein